MPSKDWGELQKKLEDEFQKERHAYWKKNGIKFFLIGLALFLIVVGLWITKDWQPPHGTPTYSEDDASKCIKADGQYYGKMLGDSSIEFVCIKNQGKNWK